MSFTPLLRRIREDKTNYRKRKGLLIGKQTFVAVRLSNENVLVQISKAGRTGDNVLVSAHSRELAKRGWKGSGKNMPACYLTGLLAGAKAVGKGVSGGILYTGNRMFTPRIAAATKGLIDGGVKLAVDEEILPSEERINGKHIADYANMLKGDKGAYSARFPGLTKKGFAPENYPQHFEEVKASILDKGGKVEPRKKVEKTGEKEAKVKPEVKKEAKKEKKETKGERKKPLKKEGKKR